MIEAAYDNDFAHQLDGLHRKLNYDICNAIDPLKTSMVLNALVEAGMSIQMKEIFQAQADSLLAAIRSENNRLEAERQRKKN